MSWSGQASTTAKQAFFRPLWPLHAPSVAYPFCMRRETAPTASVHPLRADPVPTHER